MRGKEEIWVAGEALIDLIPDESMKSKAIVGGGPANTAKSIANLGYEAKFIGGISKDSFGQSIQTDLISYGVNLDLVHYSNLPTATATVSLNESGTAQYVFSLRDTATFEFHKSWLPHGVPKVLHIGSLATIIEPGSIELLNWVKELPTPIVFDPNVRPSVLSDPVLYREYVEKWMRISSVVKMSEDDLTWLYPQITSAAELLKLGPQLIVVTHGERGLTAHHSSFTTAVPGVRADVVDTVGAGDTVGAIIVESIVEVGLIETFGNIKKVLHRAARAAAITCSRAGANPPTRDELENF